jgi:lysozyme family protein
MPVNLTALAAANAKRWAAAKVTRDAGPPALRLVKAKDRYQAVAAKTGVPWFVIAVIHERESSQDWDKSLAQGDPWNAVSVHVPKGRGPFSSWEAAAIDALANCPPYAAGWRDWTVGGALTLLEKYNGLGYSRRGLPSPYLWAGTDQYVRGKYTSDGMFDSTAVDKQLGCACLLLAMQKLDSSIQFAGDPGPIVIIQPKPDIPPPPVEPSVTNPAPGSLGAWIVTLLKALFGKKP